MNFPKFNELCTKAKPSMTISDELRLTFSLLPEHHLENIYLIILHYAVLENMQTSLQPNLEMSLATLQPNLNKKLNLPYKGTSSGKGVIFNLDNFPKQLECLIAAYMADIVI